MNIAITLFEETNIISLRTAFVIDVDGFVDLQLLPIKFPTRDTGLDVRKREYLEWYEQFYVKMYQHQNAKLEYDFGLKKLAFLDAPKMKAVWDGSGNSVAVCMNDEPWAFIDHKSSRGYSKGIIESKYGLGKPWDQKLFEEIFFR